MGSAASTGTPANTARPPNGLTPQPAAVTIPEGAELLKAPNGAQIVLVTARAPSPQGTASRFRQDLDLLKPAAVFAYHPSPALLLHSGAAAALPSREQLLRIASDLSHVQDMQSQPARSFGDVLQGWQLPPAAASLLTAGTPDDAGAMALTFRGMGPSLWYGRVIGVPLHLLSRLALTAALQRQLPVALLDAEWCAAGEAKALLNDKVAPLPTSQRPWSAWLAGVAPALWPGAEWPFLLGSAAAVCLPPLDPRAAQRRREEQAQAPAAMHVATQNPVSCADIKHASLHWHPPETLFQGIPAGWAPGQWLPTALHALDAASHIVQVPSSATPEADFAVPLLRRGAFRGATRADDEQVEAVGRLADRLHSNATWNLAHTPGTAWTADVSAHGASVARRALHACRALQLGSGDTALMVLPPVLAQAVARAWEGQCVQDAASAADGLDAAGSAGLLQAGFAGGARRWADVQVGGCGDGGSLGNIGGNAPMLSPSPGSMGVPAGAMGAALSAADGMPEWWRSSGLPLQLQATAAASELGRALPPDDVLKQQSDVLQQRFEGSRRAHVACAAGGALGVLGVLQAAKRIHRNAGLLVGAVVGWQVGTFWHQQDARALLAARKVTQEETLIFADSTAISSVAAKQATATSGTR